MSRRDTRWRRKKQFRVTRTETYVVSFIVEETSQLKARQAPTPADAERRLESSTQGFVKTLSEWAEHQ